MSSEPQRSSLGGTIGRTLASAFFLRPGESWPVVMMLSFSFFVGMASAFLYAASIGMFLGEEGNILYLPYIYIASSVIIVTSGIGIDKVQGKIAVQRFLPGVVLFVSATTLVFGILGWMHIGGQVWLFGVIIWYNVIVTLINIVQLSLPSLIFDLRQSKRLYGLITSGELLASAAGFLLVPLLVGFFGIITLVSFAAVTFLLAGIVVILILRKYKDQIARAEVEQAKEDSKEHASSGGSVLSKETLKDRYIIQLCLLVFFSLSSYYFIDFAFNQVAASMGDANAIAVFIGYFFAAAEGLVFFIKTFLSGRIVNKFGVRISLSILPVLLLLGTILGGVFSPTLGLALALSIFVQLDKLFDTVFRSAVHEPGFAILYQPLRPKQRMTAQTLTQGIVDPFSMGVAGVALIFLANAGGVGTIILVGIILVMTAGWITVTYTINRDYTAALMKAMKGRILDGSGAGINDPASRRVLLDKLQSPLPGEVMYALNILEKNGDEALPDAVMSLAEHADEDVRVDVLERAARLKIEAAIPLVARMMQPGAPVRVRAAAVKAYCALSEEEALDQAGVLLDDESVEVRIGAMTGLLRNGGIDGILVAGDRLIKFGTSTNVDERRLAARIIGEVGVMSFYRPLRDLMHDADQSVQDAALHAAGRIKNIRLLPTLIEALGQPHVHSAAAGAIVSLGAQSIPQLAIAYDNPGMDVDTLIRVSRVVGRIRGTDAINLLRGKVLGTTEPVRNQVLFSLSLCQYHAEKDELGSITDEVRHEVACAYAFMLAQALLDGDDAALLRDALKIEQERIRGRIFYMLSFLYEPKSIFRARDNLVSPSQSHRAFALEMLDTAIEGDIKKMVFPLFEEVPFREKIGRLAPMFGESKLSLAKQLHVLLQRPDTDINAWTKACIIRTAAARDMREGVEDIVHAVEHPERYVREAAVCALHVLAPERFATLSANVRRTDPTSLAPIITALTTQQATPMLLTIEKVIILKTVDIFSETPDDVLVEVASILEEETSAAGAAIIVKGDVGNCMYIIHEGKVRVHDGDITYTELGSRQSFGEMALLDNDTRSASITAIDETVLLRLDQDALYEIMSDRIEVARGIIRELTKRLRRNNEAMMKLKRGEK